MAHDPLQSITTLISRLRGENGCPWDRKQTPQTMSRYVVEEAHELVEAISGGDPDAVREELGDILFLIFFIAYLYGEAGIFDIEAVAETNVEKMIRRHPHVFGEKAELDSADAVRQQWNDIKLAEKKGAKPAASGPTDSKMDLLDAVPASLPALMRAYLISERAERSGLMAETDEEILAAADREWAALRDGLKADGLGDGTEKKRSAKERSELMGRFLFRLVRAGRRAGIHPESALEAAIAGIVKGLKEDLAERSENRPENRSGKRP